MENVIHPGDHVNYCYGWYTYSNNFDEYGDREVIDEWNNAFGKVLITVGNSSLIYFYSNFKNEEAAPNIIFINEAHAEWMPNDYLEKIQTPEKIYIN